MLRRTVNLTLRRALAFGLDLTLFGLFAWLTFTWVDGRARHLNDFAPFQARYASHLLWPLWGLGWSALFVVPTRLWGATPGKRAFGLTVVDVDGQPLGWGQAFARETVLKWLSLALDGAGYVEGVLTGVALHDTLAGTRVFPVGEVEPTPSDEPWAPTPWPVVAAYLGLSGFMYLSMSGSGFLYGLLWRGAFYLPHEAGHLVVGAVFPHLIGVAAGAWGQLLFPAVAAVSFARRRLTGNLAGALAWAAFSLFDIGRYAADAWDRELALPVAMGDELTEDHLDSHDWWQLLSAAHQLHYAEPVGHSLTALGWLIWAAGLLFLVRQARETAT
jgi:uncharacterized RDD family membrane protein YckC